MANKSLKTRANVHARRGELPEQRHKIVDNKPLDKLRRQAEKLGLILHVRNKPGKK